VDDEKPQRETLKPYSLRLTSDQVRFLQSLPNANAWVRKVINEARVRDSATSTDNRVILLTQQIADVEEQIRVLRENPSYVEAWAELEKNHQAGLEVEYAIEHYEKLVRGEVAALEKEGLWYLPKRAADPTYSTWPYWREWSPEAVVEKAKHDASEALPKIRETHARLIAEERKPRTIVEGFKQEIQGLQAKRQALEQELLRQSATSDTSVTPR